MKWPWRHIRSFTPELALLLGVGLWSGCEAHAAETARPAYTVRIWQTDDGLPHNSVSAIAQTADGYLWIGTREGLARFDGLRFTPVEEKAAPELKHGWITALRVTTDGSLWIACEGQGVVRFKTGAVSRLTETDGLPGNQPRCLWEAKDGALWIGSEGGLARYAQGKITRFTDKEGMADNSVRALCEDGAGRIRVATRRGLSTLEGHGAVASMAIGASYNANALRALCPGRDGQLWVGSTDGLYALKGGDKAVYGVKEGLADRVINALWQDQAGQIWVGTYGGLTRIVGGKVVAPRGSESLFGDLIYTLFEDAEGNLWAGGRDGLYRLSPARFTTLTTEQGLTGNNVMSVCEEATGTVWIGIWGGGLNAWRDGKLTAYRDSNGLLRDTVLSLAPVGNDTVWVGMDIGAGLNCLRSGIRTNVARPGGWGNAPIRVIHQDSAGTLWVGTGAGLHVLKGGEFQLYTRANGLPADSVLAICDDGQGGLWIGTEAGLSHWQGGKFTNCTMAEGLSHNIVTALYLDAEQTLWIGTRAGGLNRLKAGRLSAYTSKQGLFSDEIYEIVEDDFGCLWMSCRRGLFRIRKQEVAELDRGARRLLTCAVFGKADGLLSVQCNGVAKPAGCKGREGRLWFPTIRGVVAVDSTLKTNDKIPPVAIEEIYADRKPVRTAGAENPVRAAGLVQPLRIAPGRGELEIHYSALSLQAPEKNRFRYRLEPLESSWTEAGPQRTAHYNSLAPGRYKFRVLGCNNDGVWSETGAALELVLLPHAWQTWWFQGSALAGIAGLLTLLYRMRLGQIRALEHLRVQIAANLHDDVGARLTKLAMITEQMDQETGAADRLKASVQAIFGTTHEVIQAMDEIVWTINPKNDTLDNLANYIFQYAQEYFQDTGVRCRLDVPAQLPDLPITTEVRHNLFMAVKEALNNVLKHAAATEVRLSLALADSLLLIRIVDNGRGFAADQPHPGGDGLDNMKQRLAQIGGRFVLESRRGQGTSIQLEVEAK